jgi:hypothetical protein
MAGRGAPSFLKRQKEQKRAAKAVAKRAAQQARRDDRAARAASGEPLDDEFEVLTGPALEESDEDEAQDAADGNAPH